MGQTRGLFKKIRDTKVTLHAKMGSIKDRNGMDITKAEDIMKRWQEYTKLYKKDLNDPDKHDAVTDWWQEEKGTTEDEMAGWHHGLDRRESQ